MNTLPCQTQISDGLSDHQIDVWLVHIPDFISQVSSDCERLDSNERNRANRFKFERDRNSFIVSHAALRNLLSHYLNVDPAAIQFEYNQYQKPHLAYPSDQAIHFNLSHSHDYALVAVTRHDEIGADIEFMRETRDLTQIAERFFAIEEFDQYAALPNDQKLEGFYNAWTRKEAFIKAIGQGLYYSLKDFVVSLLPQEPAKIIDIRDPILRRRGWWLFGFLPAENYCAAIVVQGGEKILRLMRYQS